MSLIEFIKGEVIVRNLPMEKIIPLVVKETEKDFKKNRQSVMNFVRETLMDKVPQRTGKLLDTLLNTLTVEVRGTNIYINAHPPVGYPIIIQNPQHFGAIVYGYGKYIPTNPTPKSVKIRETPKGAYYLANDSNAVGPYMDLLDTYIVPTIIDTVLSSLPNYTIQVGTKIPLEEFHIRIDPVQFAEYEEGEMILFEMDEIYPPPPVVFDVDLPTGTVKRLGVGPRGRPDLELVATVIKQSFEWELSFKELSIKMKQLGY